MSIFRIEKKTIGRPQNFKYPLGLLPNPAYGANVAETTTGGSQIVDGPASPTQNAIHKFTTSGTFSSSFTGTVEYFIVAGGGGGGYQIAGGGGAGGVLYNNSYPVTSTNYTITIGAGGNQATRGGNTHIGSIFAHGGGQGGSGTGDGVPGTPGGCGGGGARRRLAPSGGAGGLAVNPQPAPVYKDAYGNNGGVGSNNGNPDNNGQGAGGGGINGAGGNASPSAGGGGGAGLTFAFDGSSTAYGGGGGGGVWGGTAGGGGSGIGGAGCPGGPTPGGTGVVNRGSGGGGGGYGNSTGGAGGSGYAVIKYITTQGDPNAPTHDIN